LAGSAQPSASIGLLLVEIPLLAESSGFTDLADEVVCIIADADIRLQRATARGMGAADALDRMALQASDEQRMAISDTVIDNNGGLEALAAQAEDWYARRTMDRLF
jgi:dephospho-CoA kinase